MTTPITPDTRIAAYRQLERIRAVNQSAAATNSLLDASNVQSSAQVEIATRTETMRLLLKSLWANIHEAFTQYAEPQPSFPPDTLGQPQADQNITPESTASSIATLARNMFGAFLALHPGENPPTVVELFFGMIRKAIDRGFKEARDILHGLGVLQGEVAAKIDRTYELLQTKLADFQTSAASAITQQG